MAVKINMENIKTVARESRTNTIGPYSRSGAHLQVNVDTETGEVWSDYLIGESWEQYHNPNILTVCNLYGRITQADLLDAVKATVAEAEHD
jgi:hypothetical protein